MGKDRLQSKLFTFECKATDSRKQQIVALPFQGEMTLDITHTIPRITKIGNNTTIKKFAHWCLGFSSARQLVHILKKESNLFICQTIDPVDRFLLGHTVLDQLIDHFLTVSQIQQLLSINLGNRFFVNRYSRSRGIHPGVGIATSQIEDRNNKNLADDFHLQIDPSDSTASPIRKPIQALQLF